MRVSHQVVPPGGWRYIQEGIWLYGETFDELLTAVIAHRVSNKMSLGNVASDIEDQIAKRHPSILIH